MFELIAQGNDPEQRWRRRIPEDQVVEIGRLTRPLSVGWDSKISRRHMVLRVEKGRLRVEKIAEAANPIFYRGNQLEKFYLSPGETFVVGDTKFSFSNDQVFVTQDVPNPIRQRTFTHEFLREVRYDNADQRMEVLNRLPEVIGSAGNEKELLSGLTNILLSGISTATAVAMVRQAKPESESEESTDVEILHWDRPITVPGVFQPSGGLIRQAIQSGESVLHIWDQTAVDSEKAQPNDSESSEYTIDYENDWAFVCPLVGKACRNWGIYVAGKNRGVVAPSNSDLAQPVQQGDIKFAELVGATLANVLQIQKLERQQTSLRNFFSPLVLEAFSDQDPEQALKPRECEVSVLFCDLRGFAQASERMADDLLGLLSRVSDALGIMTRNIMDLDGVVGDFHGDAAMGFWGWPFQQENTAASACAAALAIQLELEQIAKDKNNPLHNFQMGVGVATGVAVAGQIGTNDQVKVTAFGPVVNLASRLESLTRKFGASVLLDEATVKMLPSNNSFRLRKIVKVLPYGLKVPTTMYQLFTNDDFDSVYLNEFSQALQQFENGDWDAALLRMRSLDKSDCVKDFLIAYAERSIAKLGNPPEDWDGVIALESK